MPGDKYPLMDLKHGLRFPGESLKYRAARDKLLQEEIELRRHLERVAAHRRELPPGGEADDYLFDSEDGPARLSQLFEPGKQSLVTYNWMFGPERKESCPSCAAFLDALDGAALHIMQRVNLVVIARSPIERLAAFKHHRGWRHLDLMSSAGNSFNADYFALTSDGMENPMLNVFHRDGDVVRHFWGSEMFYAPTDAGQHPRHNGTLDLFWNVFDLTPEGRGTDGLPRLTY